MNSQSQEQTALLREILKWIKFAGMKEVKGVLKSVLDTDQKKIIYQLSDGENSSRWLAKAAGVSDFTVRNYWKAWARIGIVEPIRAGTGERYKRSFDLEDLGIEVPKLPTVSQEKEGPSEPAEPTEKESTGPKLEEFQQPSEGKTDA